MPTSYDLDVKLGLVRSRAWSVLTEVESRDHYAKLKADPAFHDSFRQLCDLRSMERIETSSDALRELARMHVFAAGVRRAFVAPTDAHFGLARMLQVFCEQEGTEIGVFRTMAQAEDWLELPPGSGDGTGSDAHS
jgi:hypothetical protein